MAVLDIAGAPWIPVMFLMLASFFFRFRSGTWFAPSAFAGLFWSAYLSCSLLAVESHSSALGLWVIASLVVMIQSAAAFGEAELTKHWLVPHVSQQRTADLLMRVRQACWFFNLVSLAGCVYFVFASLEYFDLSFTFASLLRLGGLWTLQRYNFIMDPWPLRIAAIWPYPAALLGGILKSLASRRGDKVLAVLSLIPAVLISLLLGGRAGLLLALTFWFGAYWTTDRARTGAHRKLFAAGNLTLAIALAGGLLFFFVFVFALRDLTDSDENDVVLVANSGQIRNYMFGSPAAFSQWFDNENRGPLEWGALTFPGFFDVMGLKPRTIGTYTDYANTTGLEEINIYTMFRGLIQDFSFLGTVLVGVAFGFLSGRVYSVPSLSPRFILVLSAYYAIMLFSPLINVFAFNSSIFAWAAAWFVLRPLVGLHRAPLLSPIPKSTDESVHNVQPPEATRLKQ
jgi:oligosaccharide repeat unit polymerase